MYARRSRFLCVFLSVFIWSIGILTPAFAGKPTPPPPPPPPPPSGTTTLISIAPAGSPGNSGSYGPSMSADVRYVAFGSDASDLVAGDSNNRTDVFVRDRPSGGTERVSVANDGTQGDNHSYIGALGHSISADGRYVVFASYANNLVSGPQHYYSHVYVHDRIAHATERVSVATDGTAGDSYSYSPAISADGRYVVFWSYASNLVAADTNAVTDVFVRDLLAGTTERVSLANGGAQGDKDSRGGVLSGDGRYVAFISDATNLVSGDTNAASDVFVYDRVTQIVERVSISSGGAQGNNWSGIPSISTDGRFVAFSSEAGNLVTGDTNGYHDVFVRDRIAGTTERVSVASSGAQGDYESYLGAISADGRFVGFIAYAANLVSGDTNYWGDSFIRDRLNGVTERISLATDGTQGDSDSQYPIPSADGQFVVFDSFASNFSTGDTNGQSDVFMRERSSP